MISEERCFSGSIQVKLGLHTTSTQLQQSSYKWVKYIHTYFHLKFLTNSQYRPPYVTIIWLSQENSINFNWPQIQWKLNKNKISLKFFLSVWLSDWNNYWNRLNQNDHHLNRMSNLRVFKRTKMHIMFSS